MRALRALEPVRIVNVRQTDANQRLQRAAFAVSLLAVGLEFVVSADMMADLGAYYAGPTGNLLAELHPATVLIFVAVLMTLLLTRPAGANLFRLFHDQPALATLNLMFLFCAVYSVSNLGIEGAAIYVESFLSAGLLAVALAGGTDSQKRTLAWWIIGFCLLSIVISVGHGLVVAASTQELAWDADDFRSAGLFGSEATAALVTSMAVFLLLRMRMYGLLKAVFFTMLLVGLVLLGQGAELTMTLIMLLLTALVVLVRGLVMRTLSLGVVGVIGAAIVILPALILIPSLGIDTGEPTLVHMSEDDGAGAASLQWMVLNHLDLRDVLFGASPARLEVLKSQISPGQGPTEIENFWLHTFLNFGAICSVVLLSAVGLLLVHLGRMIAHPLGWLLLLTAVLITTTGDLNGAKRADLVFMTACMIAMHGYARSKSPLILPRRTLKSLRGPSDGRMVARLGGRRPTQANLAGQQS